MLLIASFPDIINRYDQARYGDPGDIINNELSIPMTIVMPAYNLSEQVFEAVSSLLNSNYKNIHILIVNDGSTDDTLKKMKEVYKMYKTPFVIKEKIKTAKIKDYYESHLYPNLVVIDKEHSNTGDTLNVGINACRTPIFASVDADTLVEKDAITQIMFAFLSQAHCISVGGAVYVINGNKAKNGRFIKPPHMPYHLIPSVQVCEYLRSFLFSRSGWNAFGGALSYAGAFTLFETEAAIAVGGYDTDNFAQDAEIILKLHAFMLENKFPYKISYTPAAISWTEVPWNLFSFWKQRDHWQRGLIRSFCLHRNMLFNPKYGIVGLFTYPAYVAFELLSPLIEFTAYFTFGIGLWLGIVSYEMILLFLALAVGYAAFLTIATIFLNLITFNMYSRFRDTFLIFLYVFVEMLGFRQYHAACKTVATGRYMINRLLGKRL